jgi:hypothetical protein
MYALALANAAYLTILLPHKNDKDIGFAIRTS